MTEIPGPYKIAGVTSIGQTLYAIDDRGNVYRTTDYGATWQRRDLTTIKRFSKPGDQEAVWEPVL